MKTTLFYQTLVAAETQNELNLAGSKLRKEDLKALALRIFWSVQKCCIYTV